MIWSKTWSKRWPETDLRALFPISCDGLTGQSRSGDIASEYLSLIESSKEDRATGATAWVTSCPWCERNFKNAAVESGLAMSFYDVGEKFGLAIRL